MPKLNVFLSSPDPQSDALSDFRMALIKHGFNVFTNDGILPDSDLAKREISIADCVVVGLTRTDSESDRFHKELNTAISQQKKIVVAQLEEADIPPRLQDYPSIQLQNNFDIGLQMVTIAIAGKLPDKPMRFPEPKAQTTTPSLPTSQEPQPKPAEIPPPIRPAPKPLTSTTGKPLSEESANPATVIAVMFAIIVIGFVILTNLPSGNTRLGAGGATSITQQQISNTLIEYTASHTRFILPTTWQDITNNARNSPELRNILGTVDTSAARSLLQMGFNDRETDSYLWIFMSNIPGNTTLAELNTALQGSQQASGVELVETRIRSFRFGDGLFVYLRTNVAIDDPLAHQYMVITLRNQRMYMILMASPTENRQLFDTLITRFEIIN